VRGVVELSLHAMARPARAVAIARALGVLRVRVAALDHEARDHAVEGGAVVETLARQVQEVLHVSGGLVGQELDLHLPEFRFDDGARGRGFGHDPLRWWMFRLYPTDAMNATLRR